MVTTLDSVERGRSCKARATLGLVVGVGSLVVVVGLGALLKHQAQHLGPHEAASNRPLILFCAAGLKSPIEAVARQYEKAYGVAVQIQYGGSGTLLSSLRVTHAGDLFLAADESYIKSARDLGLMAEVLPLAQQRPVIAVAKGNPKGIHQLEDLSRGTCRFAIANPDAASIGRTVRGLLQKSGQWSEFEKRTTVFKPTVNDVANDVRIGSVDAGIVWDATAQQYPELEMVRVPLFEAAPETVSIGVLTWCGQPVAALHFARYLAAREKGLKEFEQAHYTTIEGDEWAETPELRFFSGAMLRPGVEETLREFEAREGCRITTVYNGCGLLVAQMRAGEHPDAYFSCDKSFMSRVADLYGSPVTLVDDTLVLLVKKGNPERIGGVNDLTRPGLRVGLPHHEKSAMGNIAWRMLQAMDLYDKLGDNLKVESPTGDFLVNQIRTGSLDAIIACKSHAAAVQAYLDAIPINHPLAHLEQPFAVGRSTHYRQMTARLLEALISPTSRQRFESAGFGWRYQPSPLP